MLTFGSFSLSPTFHFTQDSFHCPIFPSSDSSYVTFGTFKLTKQKKRKKEQENYWFFFLH